MEIKVGLLFLTSCLCSTMFFPLFFSDSGVTHLQPTLRFRWLPFYTVSLVHKCKGHRRCHPVRLHCTGECHEQIKMPYLWLPVLWIMRSSTLSQIHGLLCYFIDFTETFLAICSVQRNTCLSVCCWDTFWLFDLLFSSQLGALMLPVHFLY